MEECYESLVLQRNQTKRCYEKPTQGPRILKRQATFKGHMMRKEKLEHLVTNGMIEGKCNSGKQREKMLDGRTKLFNAGRVIEALRAKRDRDAWNVIIVYAREPPNLLVFIHSLKYRP